MTLHPHLSLVITQGTPRGALISGHIIYQAASFSCILCCTEHCAGCSPQCRIKCSVIPQEMWQVRYLQEIC